MQVDLSIKSASAAARSASDRKGGPSDRVRKAAKPESTLFGSSRSHGNQESDTSRPARKSTNKGASSAHNLPVPNGLPAPSTAAHAFEITQGSPVPTGALPEEEARQSPAFQYDGNSAQKTKSDDPSSLGRSAELKTNGVPSRSEYGDVAESGRSPAHSRFESAPAGQHAFGNTYPKSRGTRGGLHTNTRGNARFGNGNFGRSGGPSPGQPYGQRFSPNFASATLPPQQNGMSNGYSTSPPQNNGLYMPYPEFDPYFMQQQQNYMAFNPYGPSPNYGYPANGFAPMPYAPYVAAPPSNVVNGAAYTRPQPKNAQLLLDPPMDPTAYWILGQIEFYMSEDNLARDTFLREQVSPNCI